MFSAINRKVKRFVLRQHKKKPVVWISDTTLRDGAQMPGIRLNPEQKLTIAKALAAAGVHSIDCGFPAASPNDVEGIRLIAKNVKGSVLSALSRTVKSDIELAADALSGVSPLKRAITLFMASAALTASSRVVTSPKKSAKNSEESAIDQSANCSSSPMTRPK